jgi:teichuronic acid exporter
MTDNLQNKTVNAFSWSFADAILTRGAQFIVGIILARLLLPEEVGLIGMLAIFIAVAWLFLDSGFGAGLIQKQDASQTDICSIFYFSVLIGILATGLVCLVAPWVADFYGHPILTPLLRLLSLIILISSFGLIQSTLLTKNLNFKTQTTANLIASTLSGITGVTMAVLGYGVWSLAIQQVSHVFFATICLWFLSPWRPALLFSFRSLRELFPFGSRLLVSSVLDRIFDNIYLVVIGKLFSASDLGLFTRAKSLEDISSRTLPEVVGRVTFPVFSSIKSDPAKMKRGFRKALTVMALVNFPILIGLAVMARPLVLVLLTEKWVGCVPYLQLLCVGGLVYSLDFMNLNLIKALGRSDLVLRLEIVKKVLIVINIAVTWRWGISAMIYGMIITSIISYYVNCYYNGILLNYSIGERVRDLLPYVSITVLMGLTVFAAGLLPFSSNLYMILAQTTVGVVTYGGLCWLARLSSIMHIRYAISEHFF